MRLSVIFALTISACLVLPIGTFAADSNYCQPTKYLLVFGNGVYNDYSDVQDSIAAAEAAVRSALPEDKRPLLRSDLAYNSSEGLLGDLIEATRQSFNSDYRRFWRILLGLTPMPQSFQNALSARAGLFDASNVQASDLANHVLLYKKAILEGNVVTVVAHSQGNFYANESYESLTADERKSIGIVGVATPDTFVEGGGTYTTLSSDRVISTIAAARLSVGLWPPLSPNVNEYRNPFSTTAGHGFINSYMLAGTSSRNQIVQQSIATFNRLTPTDRPAKQGTIVATLTWGAQPDVDLHTFEPNGSHVYYAQKQGISGSLDVDDVSGFGPEHYTVPCATLQAGTYFIGVNYFYGEAPETAHIEISAGQDTNRSYDVPLPIAVGSAGNASPVPVARVVVEGSDADGYQFTVYGATPQSQNQVRLASVRKAAALGSSPRLFKK